MLFLLVGVGFVNFFFSFDFLGFFPSSLISILYVFFSFVFFFFCGALCALGFFFFFCLFFVGFLFHFFLFVLLSVLV